jgi:competence protein ComGC
MEFLKELWQFMKVRKKFWLLPLIIVLLIFALIIIVTAGTAIAPFIYTLF